MGIKTKWGVGKRREREREREQDEKYGRTRNRQSRLSNARRPSPAILSHLINQSTLRLSEFHQELHVYTPTAKNTFASGTYHLPRRLRYPLHITLARFSVKTSFTHAILVPANRHVRRRATLNVGGYPSEISTATSKHPYSSEIRHCSRRTGPSSAPDRR
ncbi:uncharacterized protein LY79DRAFT_292085 [Colletotrichum navitas]|uniref:Uncharacterized protein n=1 Tax=Colletotrichum navitas TaxID=681940 RepID=A0AAD8PVM3_9PEZI|nr:uncharacterized protein LY79DRAFT_292085 [Colletotrichum navitas]KAK1584733.1 hypothetical protein LY79DRAFT_292085 [Colletotrichum navitas]